MLNNSLPDSIIHQLETLSLKQLLELKTIVNNLIASKSVIPRLKDSSSSIYSISSISLIDTSSTNSSIKKVFIQLKPNPINPDRNVQSIINKEIVRYYKDFDFSATELELVDVSSEGEIVVDKTDDSSVKNALSLVEQWLENESDYDEVNYPEIEIALQKNRGYSRGE